MANEEHVQKLREGVEAWNAWVAELRAADNQFQIDLIGANLTRADLRGAYLMNANLINANLMGANLMDAYLADANLRGALLTGANLMGADLRRAYLRALLSEANLSKANLSEANLSEANLSGASLSEADLTDADLTNVSGLEVDSCRVVHTRFSPNATDKWSVLRRTYTGANLVLNLLFAVLFFAPLIIKGASLAAVGDAQQRVIEAVNHLDGHQLRMACDQPDGAITGVVGGNEVRVSCRSQPVWKMLLGVGGPYGPLIPTLTITLVLYQAVRYRMTILITAMRDAEERSGISPPRDGVLSYRALFLDGLSYRQLYPVHQVLKVVWWATIAAFVLRASQFLSENVIFIGSGQ